MLCIDMMVQQFVADDPQTAVGPFVISLARGLLISLPSGFS